MKNFKRILKQKAVSHRHHFQAGTVLRKFLFEHKESRNVLKMFMPKQHRTAIYRKLFNDGVMVTKQRAKLHPELDGIPNLHLIKSMQSLKSRGLVKERFVWGHFYWYLNNEGIEYLRSYLHLEAEALPETLIGGSSRAPPSAVRRQGPCSVKNARNDRAEYRRKQPEKQEKECVVSESTQFEFRGGFRGAGRNNYN